MDEVEDEHLLEEDMEEAPSMWPEDLGDKDGKQFNIDNPGKGQDMLNNVTFKELTQSVDFKRLLELTKHSEKGTSQLAYFIKHWKYKRESTVRLLSEELDKLSKEREEIETKKLEILQELCFEEDRAGSNRQVSIIDKFPGLLEALPKRKKDISLHPQQLDVSVEYGTTEYWKERATQLDKLLEASLDREQALTEKLRENVKNLEAQAAPVEEFSQILKRADHFLHFILHTAPIIIAHQDTELRYRFIYNHFPSLAQEDVIGKKDEEILSGEGMNEIIDFKKEVLNKGIAAKREVTYNTPLFGAKTFITYCEPVFSKTGETIGLNYVGVDITDLVARRERMAKLREDYAVQKAKETELNKTIHITEETMRAKEMLATMSHEIRSPLTGVLSIAEVLATTKLNMEQRQLVDVMLSSGDLVLQLVNDILDLSKVESGVMKLEATKFRPREVVKHVLQTAAAALRKELILEGHVTNFVPVEVIGDVLRIRQILTNLISNAVKFTHEGKVGISLYVQADKPLAQGKDNSCIPKGTMGSCKEVKDTNPFDSSGKYIDKSGSRSQKTLLTNEKGKVQDHKRDIVLCCDVYDTGIGIPEEAQPLLFKRYMQANTSHARKYGGTGLGLAICKQLVELMGGDITVTSKESHGSTFTFWLPCKIPEEHSHDDDGITTIYCSDHAADIITSDQCGDFLFHPKVKSNVFSSGGLLANMTGSINGTSATLSVSDNLLHATNNTAFSDQISEGASSCSVFHCSNGPSSVKTPCNSQDVTDVFEMRKLDDLNLLSKDKDILGHHGHRFTTRNMNMVMDHAVEFVDQIPSNEVDGTNPSSEIPDSSLKILLVEDNEVNIMVASSMLKQLGHQIDIAKNGLEAIHAVQHSCYDLILMDVCMPVMDGLQATKEIRFFEKKGYWDTSIEPSPACPDCAGGQEKERVPIIAMTANSAAESAARCLASGMDSYIPKPISLHSLKQCLHDHLRHLKAS